MIATTLALAAIMVAQEPIEYQVRFGNAEHHEATVTVDFKDVPPGPLELRMSRSSPGRYSLHEFAKNVYGVEITDGDGRELEVTRPDPHQWTVERHQGRVVVRYTLFADRADGTYSQIDLTHAHLNMPATFIWARQMMDRPIRVTFHVPAGSDWRVATQMRHLGGTTYGAPDLHYFMDSPTELSAFQTREWNVAIELEERDDLRADPLLRPDTLRRQLPDDRYVIRMAVHHLGGPEELDRLADLTRRVVDQQSAIFGEYPRFDYGVYTFIADYLPWASGDGMEHRNSTILTSSLSLGDNIMRLLGTISHEFFHSWNVERLRPRSLKPFDFERANMSRELWLAEGFTSYYDDLTIRRAGITDDSTYANGLSGGLSTVINSPGRRFFGPAEMSMRAPFVDRASWIDPTNHDNIFISYYTWGAMVGLGLDLTLRTQFDVTLDDYMRALWGEHGRTETPYTVLHLRQILGEVAGDHEFAEDFFDRYIEGTDVVDYQALLARAGLLLRPANPGRATLGPVTLRPDGDGVEVADYAIIGSPVYAAGLDRGDRILAIDGDAVETAEDVRRIMDEREPGEVVAISFRKRSGREGDTTAELVADSSLEVLTYEQAGMELSDEMRDFRESWLGDARAADR